MPFMTFVLVLAADETVQSQHNPMSLIQLGDQKALRQLDAAMC